MKRFYLIILLVFPIVVSAQITHKRTLYLLGSPFEITLVGKDTTTINSNIDLAVAECKRVENLISDWIPTTPVSEVNRNAGIKPVKVPLELIYLLERSKKYLS
jgi:thiamine biosynthesis lipoprotein